jgi:hypothetical protein
MAAAAAQAPAEQPVHIGADHLVVRGIAPIKHEYLLPVQLVARQEVAAVGSSVTAAAGDSSVPAAPVAPKSRNQQKKVCAVV